MKSKIKTFEAACMSLELDPVKVLPKVSGMPKRHQASMVAHAKLVIITEALNQEANGGKPWKPDWKNGEWDKWVIWWDFSSGAGLRFFAVHVLTSASSVGSRLCFFSREVAEYAAAKFKKLFEADYLL